MIIFCNCHLNLNHFQIGCHKATSQENVMGFQIQIWPLVMKQDIISYMSTVEDTRTKIMFITHFGRHNNWIGKLIIYQLSYEILDIIMNIWPFITPIMTILFSTCSPNSNTLICKLDTVYRYTVFNGKTSLWKFLHTYCIKQNGISNHFVIYFIT